MSRSNRYRAAAMAAAAMGAIAAAVQPYYSRIERERDNGEGITREGVNKCSRKRRHKAQRRKRK